eukprot:3878986-Prymnesium_polylepis.1
MGVAAGLVEQLGLRRRCSGSVRQGERAASQGGLADLFTSEPRGAKGAGFGSAGCQIREGEYHIWEGACHIRACVSACRPSRDGVYHIRDG